MIIRRLRSFERGTMDTCRSNSCKAKSCQSQSFKKNSATRPKSNQTHLLLCNIDSVQETCNILKISFSLSIMLMLQGGASFLPLLYCSCTLIFQIELIKVKKLSHQSNVRLSTVRTNIGQSFLQEYFTKMFVSYSYKKS